MEYSFEGDQLSADSEPGPSVFTEALVHGLTSGDAERDGDGWIGLTELYSFVSERVREQLPQQNPQMWTFGAQGASPAQGITLPVYYSWRFATGPDGENLSFLICRSISCK